MQRLTLGLLVVAVIVQAATLINLNSSIRKLDGSIRELQQRLHEHEIHLEHIEMTMPDVVLHLWNTHKLKTYWTH